MLDPLNHQMLLSAGAVFLNQNGLKTKFEAVPSEYLRTFLFCIMYRIAPITMSWRLLVGSTHTIPYV